MKQTLKYRTVTAIALFLFAISSSFLLFAQCPQNNFIVTGFQLRNENGQLFSVTDNYELGEPVTGQLWVNFGGSTTNGYNMLMFYDVFQNGVRIADDQYDCLFSGIQVVQNTWIKVRDFTWDWGDVIEIKDIFMYWETGTVKPNTTCIVSDKNNINSQCYGNTSGFTAAVPLFPKFDFASNGICNTTIQFTSQTIGGSPPFNYTFQWDFDGLGTATGPNPVFDFPGSGTYSIGLTANDGVTTTTIYKDIFIDPNFGIQVELFPTKIDDSSGMIYITVTGGTPPYTYSWTGPNGFNSTSEDIFNLSDGLYTLLVHDVNGCQQTVSYYLDIASTLGFSWKSFEVSAEESQIKVEWEANEEEDNCIYEIQRSTGDVKDFIIIGSVPGTGKKSMPSQYSFIDNSYAAYSDTFYYRIVKKSGDEVRYSPIKMVQQEIGLKTTSAWHAFPNPSVDGRIFLKNLYDDKPTEVALELYNSSRVFPPKKLTLDDAEIIDLGDLFGPIPKGLSILKIQWGSKIETIKLIGAN